MKKSSTPFDPMGHLRRGALLGSSLLLAGAAHAGMVTDGHGNVGYDSAAECDAAVQAGTARFYRPVTNRPAARQRREASVRTIRLSELSSATAQAAGLRYSAADYARGACDLGIRHAIARRLAQQMGGELLVESTPGEGSTFSFTLAAPTPTLTLVEDEPRLAVSLLDVSDAVARMWSVALRGLVQVTARTGDEVLDALGDSDVVVVPEGFRVPDESPRAAVLWRGGAPRGTRSFRVSPFTVPPALLRAAVESAALRCTPAPTLERTTAPLLAGRVLLVEDNVVNQRLATRLLERLGCAWSTGTAASCASWASAFRRSTPTPSRSPGRGLPAGDGGGALGRAWLRQA